MLKVLRDICLIRDLPPDLVKCWHRLQNGTPDLCSPFFSFEFARAVDRHRDDLRLMVIEDAGEICGFLPYHHKAGGCGVPVGGQICDYQGIIGTAPDAGPRGARLLQAAGLESYDFNHGLAAQPLLAANAFDRATSRRADLRAGFDSWQAEVSAQTKGLAKLRRGRRKIERDIGPLRMVANDRSDAAWDQFVTWKDDALRRLGAPGLFSAGWFKALVADLRATDEPHFGGMFSTLYAGDRLIAAHFGMRARHALNWWFPSYDPALSQVSPGLILLVDCIEDAARRGLHEIDFGRGSELYKRQYGTRERGLCEGSLERPLTPMGALRAARKSAQRLGNRVLPPKAADVLRRGGTKALRAGLL